MEPRKWMRLGVLLVLFALVAPVLLLALFQALGRFPDAGTASVLFALAVVLPFATGIVFTVYGFIRRGVRLPDEPPAP